MGTTSDEMAKGASILVDMGYDVIDVNLACPVKKIRKRKRGGHFLASVEEACEIAGISTDKIKSSKENFRLTEIPELKGDYSKSKMKINWSPKITFKNLVKIMVEEDITRWKKFINNEKQAWDCN